MKRVIRLIQKLFRFLASHLQTASTQKPSNSSNMFFVYQNIDNSVRKLNGSTLFDNKGSNFSINTELEDKITEFDKDKRYFYNINEYLIEDFTELLLDLAKDSPELIEIIKNKRRTQNIMSKLETLSHISDKKVLLNKDFFEYFDNPYANN